MSAEGFRRRLAEAAEVLEAFRRETGAPPSPPSRLPPAQAGARAALDDAHERRRALELELQSERRRADELAENVRRLAEDAQGREELAASAEAARVRAGEAEAALSALKERISLLSAERVRLESLRREADQAASDAEASGRAAVENLKRELRAAHAALDRAASESGAREAVAKSDADALSRRLESALARVQTLERERRLDSARGAGDASALFGELERAKAVAAALRAEAGTARAEADGRETELRRELGSARRALEEVRLAWEDARLALEERGKEVERARAAAAAERARVIELEESTAGMELRAREARAKAETDALHRKLAEADARARALEAELARARAGSAPAAAPPPAPGAAEPAAPDELWPQEAAAGARLLRLVRAPIETAYSHLRRLSATELAPGQKTLLRLAAASIAQATDSLASVELSLEEGQEAPAASSVLPVLESSLAAWEPAFRRHGVAVVREWTGALPDARHDAKELKLLIFHVLRNVLEAVPPGGRLAVKAGRGADGGLRLEFADDGPGFPAAWLARRFEAFVSPRQGRTGLGLAVVRRTLRRWGADAEAENGPSGRGARLTMSFPVSSRAG